MVKSGAALNHFSKQNKQLFNNKEVRPRMKWKLTDAYAHFGLPRFGSLEQLVRYMDVHDIGQAVAVLGPLVPDIQSIVQAAKQYPDRLRCVGIPFGETGSQRAEAVALQLDAGAMAIRLDQREAVANPEVLRLIGERGRFAYGIDACRNQKLAELYLDWLDTYQQAQLAAPHFMYADFDRNDPDRSGGYVERLMKHPRFYGILVRNHGMCGSAYPHTEYKAWMEYALEMCGYEHLMWGSEYPVLFWRNEKARAATELFREFLSSCSDEKYSRIAGVNAQEVFFSGAAPASTEVNIPEWIEQQFNRNRHVPFFPRGVELPVEDYSRLLESYLSSPEFEQGLSMADFIWKPWKTKS
jgi:predicted TIM-barrel fold metal-dependent hydrolase